MYYKQQIHPASNVFTKGEMLSLTISQLEANFSPVWDITLKKKIEVDTSKRVLVEVKGA